MTVDPFKEPTPRHDDSTNQYLHRYVDELTAWVNEQLAPAMPAAPMGEQGTDRVTGFKGTVTGHCRYITGSDQLQLTPPVGTDGDKRAAEWFDIARIDIDDPGPKGVGFR